MASSIVTPSVSTGGNLKSPAVAIGPVIPNTLANALHLYFWDGKYCSLLTELQALISMPISGLVLYGSLAHRKIPAAIGDSDVDLLVLVDEPVHGGIFGYSNGVQIDLHVQTRQTTLSDFTNNWVYCDARVVWDSTPPQLLLWQEALKSWKIKNLPSWNEADLLRNTVWAERLIRRIERLLPDDIGQARLHFSRLIAAIPTFHSHLRGVHTTSFSQWWKGLAETDPIFYACLDHCLANAKISIQQLREVIVVLFEVRQRLFERRPEPDRDPPGIIHDK